MRVTLFIALGLVSLVLSAHSLGPFIASSQPSPPDYTQEKYWAALPFRQDAADELAKGETWINDSLKEVDVFFIYPTVYKEGTTLCADVNDAALNLKIDKLPIGFQASAFNASCRVYAPRYRQAILRSYYDSINGPMALDFAYQDVVIAFRYYLEHYNHGRPFIIASHSQGSTHAWRLMHEFIDGKPLSKQLVCAYIVGMGIDPASYQVIKPCGQPAETGCYVTWSSFKDGYDPGKTILRGKVCVNPISWTRDSTLVPSSKSLGSVFLNVRHKRAHTTSARIHDNYLWVKTKIPLAKLLRVLHVLDYNLFWFDIRHNVAERIKAYAMKTK